MDHIIHGPSALGHAFKQRRKEKHISQREMGDAFRLDQSTVSDIERGASGTRLETLFRMLAALDLEMVIRPKKQEASQRRDKW
jgi:HTH-type transcriptional regulator/antitoxin HipB